MEPEETATIVRLVKSVFPQQPVDATTYDTWHLVIGHLDFAAAQDAVITLARSEKFCSAADIAGEVRRIRDERLRLTEIPAPPPELLDNPRAYQAALHAAAVAIADGRDPNRAMAAIASQARRELEAP